MHPSFAQTLPDLNGGHPGTWVKTTSSIMGVYTKDPFTNEWSPLCLPHSLAGV